MIIGCEIDNRVLPDNVPLNLTTESLKYCTFRLEEIFFASYSMPTMYKTAKKRYR